MSNAARTQQPTGSDITGLRPFRVEISDAAIDDIRERLARTRWPEKEPVGDWSMGIPLAYVQECLNLDDCTWPEVCLTL